MSDVSGGYVAVTEVPVALKKQSVLDNVQKLLTGKIIDVEEVSGIESDKTKTRWILRLELNEDEHILCRMREIQILFEGKTFEVKCQKAIECEIPQRWRDTPPTRTSAYKPKAAPRRRPKSSASLPSENNAEEAEGRPPPIPTRKGPILSHGQDQSLPTEYPTTAGYYGQANPAPHDPRCYHHYPNTPHSNEPVYAAGPQNRDQAYQTPFHFYSDYQVFQQNRVPIRQTPPHVSGDYQQVREPRNVVPKKGGFQQGMQADKNPYGTAAMYAHPPGGHTSSLEHPNIESAKHTGSMEHELRNKDVTDEEHAHSCTVEVTGPQSVVCKEQEETIEMYFESPKRSEGGPIENIEFLGDGVALVTFESEQDASRVADKVDHMLQKSSISVKLFVPKTDVSMEPGRNSHEEPLRKIIVSNLPSTAHDEFIEMFFESEKKLNAGTVVKVDYDAENNSAIVEFENSDSVIKVLKCLPINMMGNIVDVEVFDPEPLRLCTVKVTGPESIICEGEVEKLEMYFENRRSEGGAVEKIEFKDGAVYVTFESEEVAGRVADKKDHVINKREIHVQPCSPETNQRRKHETHRNDEGRTEDSDPKPQPVHTVKVTGVKDIKSRDTIQFYLENPKRAGGGAIEEIYSDSGDEDVLYVRYESEQVARRVAERVHTVDGQQLHVSLFVPPKPPPAYPNQLLIKGMKSTTTEDGLFNFIEAKAKYTPVPGSMIFHAEDEGVVMITLKEEPDFEILTKMCSENKLDGRNLKMLPVHVSNCIFVSNLHQDITSDTLQYYFENKRKSGGGPVDRVQINDDETCLVYFHDCKDVDDVLKQRHELSKQLLDVKRYFDCLGRPEGTMLERKLKVPEPVTVTMDETDTDKRKFLNNSTTNLKHLTERLHDCYADIEMRSNEVVLKCTLTKDVKDCFKLVKSWQKTAQETFRSFLSEIVVQKMTVLEQVFSKVLEKVQTVNIDNPEDVTVFVQSEERCFTVVGKVGACKQVAESIRKIIEMVMDEAEKEKQKIKESVKLQKPTETKILHAIGFPSKIMKKYPDLKVEIDLDCNLALFEGHLVDVRDAKLQLYELKKDFVEKKIDGLTPYAANLFSEAETKSYIDEKLKKDNVVGIWEVKETVLVVSANLNATIGRCVDVIQSSVVQTSLALTEAQKSVVHSDLWNGKVEEWHSNYLGRSCVAVIESKVIICSTDDILETLVNEVKAFLRQNAILEEYLPCDTDVQRLIKQRHKYELDKIAKDLESYLVKIKENETQDGFRIKGTDEGLRTAKVNIKELIKRAKQRLHTVEKPGLEKHMQSTKGKESLRTIESTMPCVISVMDDDEVEKSFEIVSPHGYSDSDLKTIAKCRASYLRTIYTAVCDMTELSSVKVIVNTTDRNLKLVGGIGKVIAKKGGPEVVKACSDFVDSNGALNIGEVFLTEAGNLKADYIIHLVAPIWKDGAKGEERMLYDAVNKILKKASKKRATSIAIPAISCGGYGFPAKKATRVIVDAVHGYLRVADDSPLTEIYLCDVKEDTVELFTKELIRAFGADTVDRLQEGQRRRIASGSSSDEESDAYDFPNPKQSSSFSNVDRNSVKMGNIVVSLKKGEIAKEKVDVIVNTTGRNLDLKNGSVSASLLKCGGPKLQEEVSAKYPKGIECSQVAVSGGHNLQCKTVLHSTISNYDAKNDSECTKALRQLVTNCLNEATKLRHRSIAFPAIGTGNLKYPKDTVASEMFDAVSKFSTDYQDSSVQDVRFVVYQKDSSTIQAFEDELESLLSYQSGNLGATGGEKGRASRKIDDTYAQLYSRRRDEEEKEDDDDHIYEELPDDSGSSYTSLNVTVKQGDITAEDSDCIVNSSNEALDLSRGAVSSIILKKGGDKMMDEIRSKRGSMKKKGYAWTKAPNLPSKKILHVVAQNNVQDWKKAIDTCLQEAEDKQMTSIGFPALGTNIRVKPEEMADVMHTSLVEFDNKKPKCLKDVRIVIFQAEMVEIFKVAIYKAAKPTQGIISKIYANVAEWWKGDKQPQAKKVTTQKKKVHPDRVTFRITSMNNNVIEEAIKRLESLLQNEIITKRFSESILRRMDDNVIMEIKAIASECQVHLQMDKNSGILHVAGIGENVMKASDKIHGIIRDVTTHEKQMETADILKGIVQWYFIEITEDGQKLQEYDKTMNFRIENAYKSQAATYDFVGSGKKYIVDFKKMKEYLASDPTDYVSLIRKDKAKEGSCEPPALWGEFKGNLKVVNLNASDREYQEVERKLQASTGSQKKLQLVQRIQNKALWQQYQAKKKQLEDQNPKQTNNENELWHGTTEQSVDTINAHGFNRSYCNKDADALGNGVYFMVKPEDASKDDISKPDAQGKKRIYYCRVLTGEYANGAQKMRVPPSKPAGGPTALYDSVVDNVQNPAIYVIFNDTQAYPEYLITFTN